MCDPQGAVLSLFKGTPSEGMEPPPPPAPGTPGHIGWHELHTTNFDDALAFYGELFGWRKGETMDMGPNGVQQADQRFVAGSARRLCRCSRSRIDA